jgi:hypothetical protein
MTGARCGNTDDGIHRIGRSNKAAVTKRSDPTGGCAKRGLFVGITSVFGRSNQFEGTAKWVQTLISFRSQAMCVCSTLVFLRYPKGKSARTVQHKTARPCQASKWGAKEESLCRGVECVLCTKAEDVCISVFGKKKRCPKAGGGIL